MKQKWPILIFSALLTAFIVLAGIWGNAQFECLHSGSVLTAQHAVQGIALDGWRQEAPGQWHFTFTVSEDIPSLTLCVTNTAVPLAPESLTSLERSGELYALDVTPGETVELVFTCGRSPQTWLMTSAFASRAFRFRTMTQLIALTAFVTMGMVLLALYHYKHLPELGYFLLYLVIMSVWALMVFFFPAIRNRLLQRILRSFFSLTVLASALLAAGLLGVKLPRSGRGLLALAAGCVVFFALSMSSYPPLRVGMLVAGMCLCLYYLMAAVNADYEGAALMLLPGAVTTGFRVWALMPGLDSVLFVESVPFYAPLFGFAIFPRPEELPNEVRLRGLQQKTPAGRLGFSASLWNEVQHEISKMAYQNLNRFTMRCHRRVKKLPSCTVSVSAAVASAAATVSAVL